MFDRFRSRLARAIAPSRGARMYAAARMSRLTQGWNPTTGSADSELWASLRAMRDRSRQLVRDNSYAKRAKVIVVNNVIGSGISMEPQIVGADGKLDETRNDGLEKAWLEWTRAENCHTGGQLAFQDLERQAFGEIFEAGEILIRKHYRVFGSSSKVPLCLEMIEPERLGDDMASPAGAVSAYYRMGIDRDEFGRAMGFWVRKLHPGEVRYAGGAEDPNGLFRVPADQMFHLYSCDRWPQSRGEPWLHAAMRRLNDMDGYAEAEIVRARGAASYMGFIESEDVNAAPNDQTDPNAQPQFDLEPGLVQRLNPGEKFNFADPNSPNANADPFMRLMLREVAAGAGPSYESLSRDYSQSNYSSSRLALLDDRDLWRVFQQFFIRSFREPLHREFVRQAVFSRAVPEISVADYVADPSAFEAVSFKPRGWSWIDPTKEVEAYIKARRAGFISTAQIVALTNGGVDLEDVWSEIQAENADALAKGILLTSDPGQVLEQRETISSGEPDAAPKPSEKVPPEPDTEADVSTRMMRELRSFVQTEVSANGQRELAFAISNLPAPVVHNHVSPQPVHINTPDVHVDIAPPAVHVTFPEQPITVNTPDVKVDVAAPVVNVTMPEQPIHVSSPDVHVDVQPAAPAAVHVTMPEQPIHVTSPAVHVDVQPAAPAAVHVTLPEQPITINPPDVHVDVAAPTTNVSVPDPRAESERGETTMEIVERDAKGFASKIVRKRSAA